MTESTRDGFLKVMRRYADCENALEGPFREIVEDALASGWTENEVAATLIGLTVEMLTEPDARSSDLVH
ncbi:hypothetical protein [Oricola cellulosilytica]|uniref:Uncharacterized protein n=1 Tax=Oricola cellulosilytica TaxID=1429082 RepID=A0A4R0PFC9_9HYPH|nr:hypothetical protein [Oricola cellulosilytica]TCD14194.1 hypothetical protein E0D97_08910 [Oricola cellulosilytica]